MADVFISYARGDSEPANQLATELRARGISVFFDKEVLVAGTNYHTEIARALGAAKAVVVLLSANTKRSSWVQEELSAVIEKTNGPRVIPVFLDSHAKENWVWPLVSDRQVVDLSNRREKISEVASRLAEELIPKPYLSEEASAPKATSKVVRILIAASVLIATTTFAFFFLLLTRGSDGGSIKGPSEGIAHLFNKLWFPLITGAFGYLVGYLVRRK